MVLVCSPATIITKVSTVHTSSKIRNLAHVMSWLSPPKLAQKCALEALRVGFPNSILCRSGYYFPRHKSGPRIFHRRQRLQPCKLDLCKNISHQSPFIPLTITYATRSPRAGAEP